MNENLKFLKEVFESINLPKKVSLNLFSGDDQMLVSPHLLTQSPSQKLLKLPKPQEEQDH